MSRSIRRLAASSGAAWNRLTRDSTSGARGPRSSRRFTIWSMNRSGADDRGLSTSGSIAATRLGWRAAGSSSIVEAARSFRVPRRGRGRSRTGTRRSTGRSEPILRWHPRGNAWASIGCGQKCGVRIRGPQRRSRAVAGCRGAAALRDRRSRRGRLCRPQVLGTAALAPLASATSRRLPAAAFGHLRVAGR